MTVTVLLRRETHGDLSATAYLDQLEASVRDFEGIWPCSSEEPSAA